MCHAQQVHTTQRHAGAGALGGPSHVCSRQVAAGSGRR